MNHSLRFLTGDSVPPAVSSLLDQHELSEIKNNLHVADGQIHMPLDDGSTSYSSIWSSSKTASEIATHIGQVKDENDVHAISTDLHIADDNIHAPLDDTTTSNSTVWSSTKTASEIVANVQNNQSNTFNSGLKSYTMPSDRAFPGNYLSDHIGDGHLSWEIPFSSDQDTNTDSSVQFENIQVNSGEYAFGFPLNKGVDQQIMMSDGTGNTFWIDNEPYDQLLNSNNDVGFNKVEIQPGGRIRFGLNASTLSATLPLQDPLSGHVDIFTMGWRFTPTTNIYVKTYKVAVAQWNSSTTTKNVAIWRNSDSLLMGAGIVSMDKSTIIDNYYVKQVTSFVLSGGTEYVIGALKETEDRFDNMATTFSTEISSVTGMYIQNSTLQKPNGLLCRHFRY
jgi:hypothetical protein